MLQEPDPSGSGCLGISGVEVGDPGASKWNESCRNYISEITEVVSVERGCMCIGTCITRITHATIFKFEDCEVVFLRKVN